jgi:tetratricopeptide (TPR) repeat protein
MVRQFLSAMAAVALLCSAASAQSAAEHIAAGNKALEARNAQEALKEYSAALALDPKNYEALWRAALTEVDLGEFEPNEARRKALYQSADQHANAAVAINPDGAQGHFALARALGRTALSLGSRDRVKYAKDVREQALICLKIEPKHAGCLHVMGVWNAEVMRLSGISRFIAKNLLGGKVFGEASWEKAKDYMLQAVDADPRRITHRLDLGRIYADMGLKQEAKSQFEAVINGEVIDYNDPHYKQQAQEALKKL